MKKNKRGILAMWLLLLLQVFPSVTISYSEKQLTQKQAEELLLNVPDAVAVKAKRGCLSVYLLWPNERQANLVFSMHNHCDRSVAASDSMGIFTVDLRSGVIWSGVDRSDNGDNIIDSPRLRALRRKFLGVRK